MKPLRVLVVMPLGTALGGGESMLRQLLVHGRGQDVEWIVVFLRDGPMVVETRALGLDVHVIEASRFRHVTARIRAIRKVARLAKSSGVNLVLGWMVAGQLTAGVATFLAGVPCVWFQVGMPRPDWLDRLSTLLPSRCVLVLSRAAAAAMARVHWSRPGVRAVIVGGPHETEPRYASELRAQASLLGLNDVMTFAGFQTNIPEWMQAMDVFVHASDREPFGIVLIEAMALGKPVIAGSEGGPAEIITDGENGLLVPYGDVGSLAHAIPRYLDDDAFAARVGAAARIRAAVFDDRTYAANVIAALRECVS
jgi:hypothetical protein